MSGRSPAGPLMMEHRVIERMIAVLQTHVAEIERTGVADPPLIDTAVDFIRTYADRCHHGKEEDVLFRLLADKPLDASLSAAMADLVADHVHGREVTRRLVDANERYRSGDDASLGTITACLTELTAFYPVHIEKEDRRFFKPCLEQFTRAEKDAMLAEFDEFDRSLIHERYRSVVEALERDR